jgi:hypothetical protein
MTDTAAFLLTPGDREIAGRLMLAAERLKLAAIPGADSVVFILPMDMEGDDIITAAETIWGHKVVYAAVPVPMVAVAAGAGP